MDELVKTVDSSFEYIQHEIDGGVLRIYVRSVRQRARCPYCGEESTRAC